MSQTSAAILSSIQTETSLRINTGLSSGLQLIPKVALSPTVKDIFSSAEISHVERNQKEQKISKDGKVLTFSPSISYNQYTMPTMPNYVSTDQTEQCETFSRYSLDEDAILKLYGECEDGSLIIKGSGDKIGIKMSDLQLMLATIRGCMEGKKSEYIRRGDLLKGGLAYNNQEIESFFTIVDQRMRIFLSKPFYKILGKGSRAEVRQVVDISIGKYYALKLYTADKQVSIDHKIAEALNEAGILKFIRQRTNHVGFQSAPLAIIKCENPKGERSIALVGQIYKGSLYEWLQTESLEPADRLLVCAKVIDILWYAHNKVNVAHCDLHPRNFFVDGQLKNPDVHLGDWGISLREDARVIYDIYPPELGYGGTQFDHEKLEESSSSVQDFYEQKKRQDVFALGSTLYQVLTGDKDGPFSAPFNPYTVMIPDRIRNSNSLNKVYGNMDGKSILSLFCEMFAFIPGDRPDIETIKAIWTKTIAPKSSNLKITRKPSTTPVQSARENPPHHEINNLMKDFIERADDKSSTKTFSSTNTQSSIVTAVNNQPPTTQNSSICCCTIM